MTRPSLFTFAPVSVFLAITVLFVAGLAQPEQKLGDGYLDRALPLFNQPPLPGMKRGLSQDDLLGKVTLVNVFSSWCGACKAEHPFLMQLADQNEVSLYGIDWKDRPGAGKAFLDQYGNPYLGTGDDAVGVLGAKLGVTGVPETYLVDGLGRIRYRHIGPMTEEVWSEVIKPQIAQLETRL